MRFILLVIIIIIFSFKIYSDDDNYLKDDAFELKEKYMYTPGKVFYINHLDIKQKDEKREKVVEPVKIIFNNKPNSDNYNSVKHKKVERFLTELDTDKELEYEAKLTTLQKKPIKIVQSPMKKFSNSLKHRYYDIKDFFRNYVFTRNTIILSTIAFSYYAQKQLDSYYDKYVSEMNKSNYNKSIADDYYSKSKHWENYRNSSLMFSLTIFFFKF